MDANTPSRIGAAGAEAFRMIQLRREGAIATRHLSDNAGSRNAQASATEHSSREGVGIRRFSNFVGYAIRLTTSLPRG